jgi:hypothetical protein
MQTLLAPIRLSRSSSLRRLLDWLRRLVRHVGQLGLLAGKWPSLTRDPAVDAWLALGKARRRRRGAARQLPPRSGQSARVIPLRPHGPAGHGPSSVNLRITM